MTRKHFEFMADWIALNTDAGDEQELAVDLAIATGTKFNPRSDRSRFVDRVNELRARYSDA